MKLLKTSLLLALAFGSAQAFASDKTFQCQSLESFPDLVTGDQLLLNCQNQLPVTSPQYWGKVSLANNSLLDNSVFTLRSDNLFKSEKGDSFTLSNNAVLSLVDKAGMALQGTLNLNGNARIELRDKAWLAIDNEVLTNSKNATIALSGNATLDVYKPFAEDIKWELSGNNTINIMADCDCYYTIPNNLVDQFNDRTTVVALSSGIIDNKYGKAGHMVINTKNLWIGRLSKDTQIYQGSNVEYVGAQQEALEHLVLPNFDATRALDDYVQLHLSGYIQELNLGKIKGEGNFIYLSNNVKRVTGFSAGNYTIFSWDEVNQINPDIHYYGQTDEGLDRVLVLGRSALHNAKLTFETPLASLDLSKLHTPRSAKVKIPKKGVVGGEEVTPHLNVTLAADQHVIHWAEVFTQINKGVTITWAGTESSQLNTYITGDGTLKLTALNPSWKNFGFPPPEKLTFLFSHPVNQHSTHTVKDLPYLFSIDANTTVSTDIDNQINNSRNSPVKIQSLMGDFFINTVPNYYSDHPFSTSVHVERGSGRVLLDNSSWTAQEYRLIGKKMQILSNSPKTVSVVIQGHESVVLGGKKYRYIVGTLREIQNFEAYNDPSKSRSVTTYSRSSGDRVDIYLALLRDMGITPPPLPAEEDPVAPITDPLLLDQPAIEAQIRLDATRLNRDLWHAERTTRAGLYSWIKGLWSYQSADTTRSDAEQSAYAAGFNLGAEYQWTLRRAQALAVSVATEWLGGTRKVGDNSYQEQRWNTALGLRWQQRELYTALSTQWSHVANQSTGNTPSLTRDQLGFTVSGEVGMKLHLKPGVDVTPFAQYNWTHFDSQYASSNYAQQHLQLGAYLTMPYANQDVTLSNKVGVSTLISLLSNDKASFQAYWNLRLSSSRLDQRFTDRLGIQIQTTLEYAPSDNRTGIAISLGADYAF